MAANRRKPARSLVRAFRLVGAAVAGLCLIAIGLALFGLLSARADPEVRAASVELLDWPAGQPPVTAVLLSDLHVGNLADDRGRLARVVAQVNGLGPDLVLIAGDFAPGHKRRSDARVAADLAPLAGLKPPLGVVAVLGNHDHWVNPSGVRAALKRLGVTVLDNQAVARGPLAIGGPDDPVTDHALLGAVVVALRATPGAKLVLSHTPEVVTVLPPDIHLLLAGHTHCGQISLLTWERQVLRRPYVRYDCDLVQDPGRTTVVSAGVGTSVLPLRLGVPPDLWLLTLHGPAMARRP